jgi:hypothetical protein
MRTPLHFTGAKVKVFVRGTFDQQTNLVQTALVQGADNQGKITGHPFPILFQACGEQLRDCAKGPRTNARLIRNKQTHTIRIGGSVKRGTAAIAGLSGSLLWARFPRKNAAKTVLSGLPPTTLAMRLSGATSLFVFIGAPSGKMALFGTNPGGFPPSFFCPSPNRVLY